MSIIQRLGLAWKQNKKWLVNTILIPFIITRLMLFCTGLLSPNFIEIGYAPPPEIVQRGYFFTPNRGLDMWARLDSIWYMEIAQSGYQVRGDIFTKQSSVAFYPLFPYLLKGVGSIVLPSGSGTQENYLILGLLITNALFIFSLVVLYKFIIELLGDHVIASRAVMLLIFFPTGFVYSCFYSESLFLLVSLASFYFAAKQRWWLAGISGLLSVLTRSVGILLMVPLAVFYMDAIKWQIKKIRWNVLFLGIVFVGLPIFLLWQYSASGNWLAPFQNQAAWDKEFSWPWKAFFNPTAFSMFTFFTDRIFVILSIFLSVFLIRKMSTIAYSLYILLSVAVPLFTGTLFSVTRYLGVVFPIFIGLGMLTRKSLIYLLLGAFFLVIQLFMFAVWSQFYWAV